MPDRRFPTSNPGLDFDRSIDQMLRDIADLKAGRNRGPGSSFGSPFRITNGTVTYSLSVDGSGNLIATNETTGTTTTIALA